MNNPFSIEPYTSKDLFCDRVSEVKEVIELLAGGSNVTLISPRRYGKTGLIYRIFDELSSKKQKKLCFYLDIFSAQSIDDFIKLFAESIAALITEESALKKFFGLIKSARPLLSYDPISGNPQLSMVFQNTEQRHYTLKALFEFLEKQKQKVILAIDEFQQIRNFKETNVEALLRTYIQPLHNVKFIFCGSKKHIMNDMFTNAKSPFYESTSCIYLEKIPQNNYADFIKNIFETHGKRISEDSIDFILEWTKRHTYYTQYLCNQIFSRDIKKIGLDFTRNVAATILKRNSQRFFEIRELITDNQWNYLKAVAKEGTISQPTAAHFLMKYKLGNAASAKKIVTALVGKELLLEELTETGKVYSVYNVFMSRWMESL